MESSQVVVAPREIADLVDRASRVRGCSVADAARLAADVTFCEIHHGGGLAAWLELGQGEPGALTAAVDAARAVDRVALDVLEGTASDGSAEGAAVDHAVEHRWTEPVPYVLLARSQAAWAQRGVAAVVTAERGTDPVRDLRVRAAEPNDPLDDERRRSDALAHGIGVDPAEWEQLEAVGAAFLIPEAALDAAAAP